MVIVLHDFPDTAHSFLDLLAQLAHAGFHAVAPFLRGYPPTELSPDATRHSGLQMTDERTLRSGGRATARQGFGTEPVGDGSFCPLDWSGPIRGG